jgi:hypothetical protein
MLKLEISNPNEDKKQRVKFFSIVKWAYSNMLEAHKKCYGAYDKEYYFGFVKILSTNMLRNSDRSVRRTIAKFVNDQPFVREYLTRVIREQNQILQSE